MADDEVSKLLKANGFGQYVQAFADGGWDDVEDVLDQWPRVQHLVDNPEDREDIYALLCAFSPDVPQTRKALATSQPASSSTKPPGNPKHSSPRVAEMAPKRPADVATKSSGKPTDGAVPAADSDTSDEGPPTPKRAKQPAADSGGDGATAPRPTRPTHTTPRPAAPSADLLRQPGWFCVNAPDVHLLDGVKLSLPTTLGTAVPFKGRTGKPCRVQVSAAPEPTLVRGPDGAFVPLQPLQLSFHPDFSWMD